MEALLENVGAWSWLVYLIIFLLVFLESAGAPIPALTLVIAAAALTAQGQLDWWSIFFATVLGGTFGGMLGYLIGQYGGLQLLERYGHYIWLPPSRLETGQQLFRKHGVKVLLFGRYLPVLCFASGIVSGLAGLNFRRFSIYNLLGIILWAGTQMTLAFMFGRSLDLFANNIGLAVAVGVGLGVIVFSVLRWRKIRQAASRRQAEQES